MRARFILIFALITLIENQVKAEGPAASETTMEPANPTEDACMNEAYSKDPKCKNLADELAANRTCKFYACRKSNIRVCIKDKHKRERQLAEASENMKRRNCPNRSVSSNFVTSTLLTALLCCVTLHILI